MLLESHKKTTPLPLQNEVKPQTSRFREFVQSNGNESSRNSNPFRTLFPTNVDKEQFLTARLQANPSQKFSIKGMTNSASGASLPFRSGKVGSSGQPATNKQPTNMLKSKNTKSNLHIALTTRLETGGSTPTIISSYPKDSD